ncbi:MAG: hypothetical protein HRU41_40725 [Saprospiraceae bacterium]|nr:hypothetical protein [Saprospiraceae bacterium]
MKQDIILITIPANGSFVYKADLRAVLGIDKHSHYIQEIRLLCKEIDGFAEEYHSKSDLVKVQLSLAIRIVKIIIERETGKRIEVTPSYLRT